MYLHSKIAICFISGILLWEVYPSALISNFCLIAGIIIISGLGVILYKHRIASSILIMLAISLTGYSHKSHRTYNSRIEKEAIVKLFSLESQFSAEIHEVRIRDNKILLEATIRNACNSSDNKCAPRCLLHLKGYEAKLIRGDIIRFKGKARSIRPNLNPDEFDRKKYYERKSIYFEFYLNNKVSDIEVERSDKLICRLFRCAHESINNTIDSDEGRSIINAMCLGDKMHLNRNLYDTFKKSGVIHVLAVSGLHVGIVYSLILALLYPIRRLGLPLFISNLLSLSGVWLFCMISGNPDSAVRASIMLSLYLAAKSLLRRTQGINILSLSACIMLLYDPENLFQLGFQLSFLALSGILILFPVFRKIKSFKNKFLSYLYDMICLSLSAQIAVLPLLIYQFNCVPTYSLVSGLIAVPMAFGIVYLGFIKILLSVGLSGLIEFPYNAISELLTLCSKLLLESMRFFEQLPFSQIENIYLSLNQTLILYSFIIFLVMYIIKGKPILLIISVGILILFASAISWNKRISKNKLVLDIYHMSGKSAFHIMHKGICYSYHDKTQKAFFKRISHKRRLRFYCARNTKYFEITPGLYRFEDQCLFVRPDSIFTNQSCSCLHRYLLSGNSGPASILNQDVQYHSIVVDGNSNTQQVKTWKLYAREQEFEFHITNESGAFTKILKPI